MDVAALANLAALVHLWSSPVLPELLHVPGTASKAVPVWRRWRRRKRAAGVVVEG
jgi:hypothetical protein